MSIDFDSAALQTQHDEEEEYDQEDYAREQELQKLLTDLPDDMLEDSRDSTPELEYSTYSNKNTGSSPESTWTTPWPRPTSHPPNCGVGYDQHSHDEFGYEARPQPWSQQPQDRPFTQQSSETNDRSAGEYNSEPYAQATADADVYNGDDHDGARNRFQDLKSRSGERVVDPYKAAYSPHLPAQQPKMFNPQAAHQEGPLGQLQREFLDSTQQCADREQLAQLQILNKAQQRQMEDLEGKLEDSRRSMRYVEHQFAIVKDEREGLAVSLKESGRLMEEAKEREVQMRNKLKAVEQQVKTLTERDQENLRKQRLAEAAVDSMKQQMLELCRSDTLSRTRQQHDRDLAVMKEQHEAELLSLEQKLDATSQALSQQVDGGQRLREHVKQLESQREEEQLERARVVNTLTQRLEESQQQSAKLLQTGSVQEMTEIQIKLQQAQSAKALSEDMNKVLQEDLSDLKEQITLYESAVKHGVIALDLNSDWENQLSESCLDLGLKKTNRKNGLLHSSALAHLSACKLPKDEALQLLRGEMQRCLGGLKAKRQKISQLQEELQLCQRRLEEAKLGSAVSESSRLKDVDVTGESQKDFMEDRRRLQEQVEMLEKKNKELEQSEEKVKSANSELCMKMREMIQELDQEKQEASVRSERVHQQHRDDVVKRIRAELVLEHDARVQQLTAQHQQQVQQLQTQLAQANDKMAAVQECYLSVCKEKDTLDERIRSQEEEEALIREKELTDREERGAALEELRAELRAELQVQHEASIKQLRAAWSKEKESEVQLQVHSHVASAKAAWEEEQQKVERSWQQRLEEAHRETGAGTVSVQELDSRLSAQKQQLHLDADKVQRRAVEEARRQTQRELHQKHLEDMAQQVEGAVTRAYSRWIEDLTSLPEYQALLQTERKKWEESQDGCTEEQVTRALRKAEEQWHQKDQLEEQSSGSQREEELREEVAGLQTQLEQVRREQAALLKAQLAGARAAWTRDKQQEISVLQARAEQGLQQAREEADARKKELLLQMEAKLQQTQEEWRCGREEAEQIREGFLSELQAGLSQVKAELLREPKAVQQLSEDIRRSSGDTSVTHIIRTSCRDMVNGTLAQAKEQWKKTSEERLSRLLKDKQQLHRRDMDKMQSSLSQRTEKNQELQEKNQELQEKNQELQEKNQELQEKNRELQEKNRELQEKNQELQEKNQELQEKNQELQEKNRELQEKNQELQEKNQELQEKNQELQEKNQELQEKNQELQKKNQELQRHLEKACRQLQRGVGEHRSALQRLKEEHEGILQRAQEEHLQQLEEVKRARESSGSSDLERGLEEMKQQYLKTVEKIRGDMLRYLQESRERAAEMIRLEVQRERQDTARRMRRYYLSCLQELLEDGGKTAGAEKKLMNAASRLAAMAKALETPVRSPTGQKTAGLSKELLPEEGFHSISAESAQRQSSAAQSEPSRLRAALKAPSQLDSGCVCERSRPREPFPRGADSEVPVRDQKRSDWSATGGGGSDAGFPPCRSASSGRKVEPVRPFSISASEWGGLSPDLSDLTVYNEVAQKTPPSRGSREPTPGSEAQKQHAAAAAARPLFSELRLRQQDSGFDSPYPQHGGRPQTD